ncbi:MAG: cyclopropane fatty acyl phospholipid synthase [Thermodesulfovibrionales bacterium]
MSTRTLLQNRQSEREEASSDKSKAAIKEILSQAGITVGGDMPWDIQVADKRFYHRVLREGSLGLGESYMDGWWDCEELDTFLAKLLPINPEEKIKADWRLLLHAIGEVIFNHGRKSRAFHVGEGHYDKGNELFRNMLDKRMVYSCAYWKDAKDLDSAQEAKLELICRKLGLKPGDRVLDIGCGWGSFARYAAENYGTEVVGITVSKEQLSLAKELCRGLPVELRLQDYRDIDERFDHVVSVGMFEHVGRKNYRTYMEKVRQCLKDDGLFLLHCIGSKVSFMAGDPWLGKYIFPNSLIPSMKQISISLEGLFTVENVQNFGFYYDATLTSWFRNFHNNWDNIKDLYDGRFYRMWKYYLLSSAGAFRCRSLQVWQFVLSPSGVKGGYKTIC